MLHWGGIDKYKKGIGLLRIIRSPFSSNVRYNELRAGMYARGEV